MAEWRSAHAPGRFWSWHCPFWLSKSRWVSIPGPGGFIYQGLVPLEGHIFLCVSKLAPSLALPQWSGLAAMLGTPLDLSYPTVAPSPTFQTQGKANRMDASTIPYELAHATSVRLTMVAQLSVSRWFQLFKFSAQQRQ